MSNNGKSFQVGDKVIHWSYGLGEIILLDEKVLSGRAQEYYVVQIRDLTLWVPCNQTSEQCLRFPTPAEEFQKLFRILASPGDPLTTARHTRRTHLMTLMRDGSLESICRVIRDLIHHRRTNKLNENDNSILANARNFLISEWSNALSIPVKQAELELRDLLEMSVV